jgi:alkyl hydroperoxide reductase subunit F
MLDTNMKTQLKAYLEKLTKPVELIATLDDSAKSAEIKELLAEIAELSKSDLQRRQYAGGP